MAKSGNNKIGKISIVLICILLFSFFIRFYYMGVNKALWWDEAVYMSKAKSIALGKQICGWEDLRPINPLSFRIYFQSNGGIRNSCKIHNGFILNSLRLFALCNNKQALRRKNCLVFIRFI